ncbi:MAG: oligosaccharide flippase family protein [Rikenellaceae bacterium]|nr:oligosaccharide flippase family protein [Rikenellaceae bacterium]
MGLAKNFTYKSILNFFSMIMPVVIMPYVYRKLNPESIGYIEYGTTFMTYFSILGMLGIYNYGLREISKIKNNLREANTTYNSLFFIGLFSNLAALILYIGFILVTIHDRTLASVMLILGGNLVANIFNTEWLNEAFESFRFITVKTIAIRLLSIICILLFIHDNSDMYIYAFITVAVLLANNLASFLYVKRRFRLNISKCQVRQHLVPLLVVLVLNNTFILYGNLNRTMLGIYTGTDAVAFYSVANKVMAVIYSSIMVIMYVSYSRLSFLVKNDYEAYKATLKKIVRVTFCIVCPVSIGLCMLSPEIIYYFAGKQYLQTAPALQVFSLYMIVTACLSILNHQVMFINGKENRSVIFFLIFGVVNMGFNFLLRHNLTPALSILSTMTAEVLLIVTTLIFVRKKLGIFSEIINLPNLRYLLISLLFIPAIYLVKAYVRSGIGIIGLSLPLCGLIYAAFLYYSRDAVLQLLRDKIREQLPARFHRPDN